MAKVYLMDYSSGRMLEVYYDSNGEVETEIDHGRGFKIIDIIHDMDTGKVTYRIVTSYLSEQRIIDVLRSDAVDVKKILKYADQGLDVNAMNAPIASKLMTGRCEQDYLNAGNEVEEVFSIPGGRWTDFEDPEKVPVYCTYENPLTEDKYSGWFDFGPKGSRKAWIDGIAPELDGQVPLQFAVSLGLAAVTHSYLKMFGEDIDNFIVEFIGLSSTGKSTAAMLAASCEGSPDMNDPQGLVMNLDATDNYLQKSLMNCNGGIRCIDEISMLDNPKNASKLVYRICSGLEKGRLSRTADMQQRSTGTFICLMTGESRLPAENGNVGINLRLLTFTAEWYRDAGQSERIKQVCRSNYGWLNPYLGLFITDQIIENGTQVLTGKFSKYREWYKQNCKVQSQKDRMSTRVAVVLAAAYFAGMAFPKLKINVEAVGRFMIDQEAEYNNERTGFGDVYDKLVSHFMANRNHFITPKKDHQGKPTAGFDPAGCSVEEWGQIYMLKKPAECGSMKAWMEIAVREPVFKRICEKELGYEDYKSVLHFLKGGAGNGCCYLNYEKGRYTRKRKLYGKDIEEKLYVIYLTGSTADSMKGGDYNAIDRKISRKKPKVQRLLEEDDDE